MVLLIFFGVMSIVSIGYIIFEISRDNFKFKNDGIIAFTALLLVFLTFLAYRYYKQGPLTYLISDYGFEYTKSYNGKHLYSKDNVLVRYSNSKFNETYYVDEKLSNNLYTDFHYELLKKYYSFDNRSLNMILEYLTDNTNESKEIVFHGNHNHITIGYNELNEYFYYKIVKEKKEYRYTTGTGEDAREEVEKNPDYDKYEEYKIFFKKYREEQKDVYDRIAVSILGERCEPKTELFDLVYYKY